MSDTNENVPYLSETFRAEWGEMPEIDKAYQDGVDLIERTLAEHGASSADALPQEVKRQLEAELKALSVVITPGGTNE